MLRTPVALVLLLLATGAGACAHHDDREAACRNVARVRQDAIETATDRHVEQWRGARCRSWRPDLCRAFTEWARDVRRPSLRSFRRLEGVAGWYRRVEAEVGAERLHAKHQDLADAAQAVEGRLGIELRAVVAVLPGGPGVDDASGPLTDDAGAAVRALLGGAPGSTPAGPSGAPSALVDTARWLVATCLPDLCRPEGAGPGHCTVTLPLWPGA